MLLGHLFRWARKVRDLEVIASGSPKKVARRARNKILGRRLSKLFRW
ncbi:MAG: hypothetical protein H5T72_04115 [Actinobacteria bacterium]|nr:hypothetical protein [Actinomycetota bacterium]